MEYDSYILELTSNSGSQDRAEHVIAEAVCAYMNELAKNAYDLYEEALRQRCEVQNQRYVPDHQAPERFPEFPLELFTSNIKTNRLDGAKWNATIQDYLLKYVPPGNTKPDPDKNKEIMSRLSALDRKIDDALSYEKDLPHDATAPNEKNRPADNKLFVVVIPVAYFVAVAIAGMVTTVASVAIGVHLHRKRQADNLPGNPFDVGDVKGPLDIPIPKSGDIPIIGSGTLTGGSGGDSPPPPPPPVPGTTQGQRRKKDNRDKKRRRKMDKDERRKARKDYYFGYVDRIEPAGNGFEIRVETIAENSLSDEVFIRQIQKLAVAAGNPSFGRYRLALISIFVHNVPSAVELGKWINFKVDTKTKKPLETTDSPNVSGAFQDGVTLLETLEPRLSFFNLRTECYFADNDGYVVQTDVKTITSDIAAGALTTLQAIFSTFDFIAEAIKDLLGQFMNTNSNDEVSDPSAAQESTIKVVRAGITLPKKKPSKPDKIKLTLNEASTKQIKDALFPSARRATQYNLYNVGQGHSGRVFSGQTEMFANDFGYGRVGIRKAAVCSHMIKDQGHLPILLSHWDADHFRIAKSFVARKYSGTANDVTRRIWVAPGGNHISGPVTHELAWNIQHNKKLLQWPRETSSSIDSGNIVIVSCEHNKQYQLPDKNNFGALALVIGSRNDIMIYPGDANFESIPGIEQWNGKVRTLIATHHGSTVALKEKGLIGGSIPQASSNQSYTLFSYAKGNTYGHDVQSAFPYYQKAGYQLVDATGTFNNLEDTFEITHFEHNWELADNMLEALPNVEAPAPPLVAVESTQIKAPATQQIPVASVREIRPGLQATSMPEVPTNWAETAQNQHTVVPNDGTSKEIPDVLILPGSGGVTPQPEQDDLLQFAIRDEDGDIVIYDITATKIILEKLPLCIPCNTDYPVTVQLSCHDIEIRGVEPQAGLVPLVRFDVASGFEWAQAADPGQDGQPGNPGYAGGRVRLAVAGDWARTGAGATAAISGLSVQYRGGNGSSGQSGGAGIPGSSGVDGGVVAIDPKGKISHSDPTPKAGTDGGNGGKGGDAGAPGIIANSEVLAVTSKWPAGWNVVIDIGSPGTDSEYGKTGNPGKGGAGALGGKGSKYTVADTSSTGRITSAQSQQWVKPDGKIGRNGDDGKGYDRLTASFRKGKAVVKLIATEDEMLDQMAPVDWRYLSED